MRLARDMQTHDGVVNLLMALSRPAKCGYSLNQHRPILPHTPARRPSYIGAIIINTRASVCNTNCIGRRALQAAAEINDRVTRYNKCHTARPCNNRTLKSLSPLPVHHSAWQQLQPTPHHEITSPIYRRRRRYINPD